MVDVHDSLTRSRNMSAIKSKNTKPELVIRKGLFALGFRYRLHAKGLPGSPDIVLKKYKTCIFVNGCFWHMHDCDLFVLPKSNTDFWMEKLTANKLRDTKNKLKLSALGWKVIVVWECRFTGRNRQLLDRVMLQIRSEILD